MFVRGYASAYSWFYFRGYSFASAYFSFREIPCSSVANASAYSWFCFRVSASVFSVKFRVRPWQMLILGLISVANLTLNSIADASGSERQLSSVLFDL